MTRKPIKWIERPVIAKASGLGEVWRRLAAAWHSLSGRRECIFVRPVHSGPWCSHIPADLIDLGKESGREEQYEIALFWFSRYEDENLPEFEGW